MSDFMNPKNCSTIYFHIAFDNSRTIKSSIFFHIIIMYFFRLIFGNCRKICIVGLVDEINALYVGLLDANKCLDEIYAFRIAVICHEMWINYFM